MENRFDTSLMVKVSQMYYINGMKQEEIAKELQISRSLISLILTEAKEAGIIEINIRNPLQNNNDISVEIENTFGIEKCYVVPTAVQDTIRLRKLVAQRAIDVFNQKVADQNNIGIAWGRTCFEFVTNYNTEKTFEGISVVPLLGGSSQTAAYYQLNEMARIFSGKINGDPYFIHAPAINFSKEEKELFLKSISMQAIQEKWKNMNVIVTGIGTLPHTHQFDRETYLGEEEISKQLEKSNAVGDICALYFDENGVFIKNDYFERILGISIDEIKKSKNVICIASSLEKVTAVMGALRTGLISILVIDEQTAKAVLQKNKGLK